jgi:hypothetical protein
MLETVPPDLNNGSEIATILKVNDDTYKGASPVPEGIDAAVDLLLSMDKPSKKVILLATDGFPQTCDTLSAADDPAGEAATIASVQAAYSEGISTFILGVGNDVTEDHLQQVANAGTGLDPAGLENALYYQALTENSLVDAMSGIITEQSVSCIYELSGNNIDDNQAEMLIVYLDGSALTRNNTESGWRLNSTTEIELIGQACEDVQTGDHVLEAQLPCPNADTEIDSDPVNSDQGSSDSVDSDTVSSIFDTIDCEGLGTDPARCEYEWCMLKQTYELELTSCAASPSTQCLQYIECYDNFFDCMGSACPLGNLVPASKNQIDVCKNTFTSCTLALESPLRGKEE